MFVFGLSLEKKVPGLATSYTAIRSKATDGSRVSLETPLSRH